MTRLLPALMTCVALAPLTCLAAAEGPQGPARPSARLVSFDDLQGRLGDPTLRLLDARPRAAYAQGHIPGAVWVDTQASPAVTAAALMVQGRISVMMTQPKQDATRRRRTRDEARR